MLVHSSEHKLFKNLLLFITAKWCINKEQKQSKTKSQVFNICQEREATRRVFPSGPGAGAVATAARLLGPPVSSGVWSQEHEIPAKKRKGKKSLNSVWLGWSTSGRRTVRSAEDWPTILCSCLEEQTPREPLTEPLVGPRGGPRHVSQPQYTELCVVNQIYDPNKLNKVILVTHTIRTN